MIPQPISELEAKAFANLMPLLSGFVIAILLTIISIKFSIRWLARPLENLNADLQEQSRNGTPKAVSPSRAHSNIRELQEIVGAYNELAFTVDNHATELAKRLYEDTVTGIGNRANELRSPLTHDSVGARFHGDVACSDCFVLGCNLCEPDTKRHERMRCRISHRDGIGRVAWIKLHFECIDARFFRRSCFAGCERHRLSENRFSLQVLKVSDSVVASRILPAKRHGPV